MLLSVCKMAENQFCLTNQLQANLCSMKCFGDVNWIAKTFSFIDLLGHKDFSLFPLKVFHIHCLV